MAQRNGSIQENSRNLAVAMNDIATMKEDIKNLGTDQKKGFEDLNTKFDKFIRNIEDNYVSKAEFDIYKKILIAALIAGITYAVSKLLGG